MSESNPYSLRLRDVLATDAERQCHLDDAFFEQLDQDVIVGGDVDVKVKVRKGSGDILTFHFTMAGNVRVLCDRCLDEVTLPVGFSDSVQVAQGDPDDDTGDVVIIPFSQQSYDYSWDMYELIDIHLPLQRVHAEGECNADMLTRFSTLSEEDE